MFGKTRYRWVALVVLAAMVLPFYCTVHHLLLQQAVKCKMQEALQGNDLVTVDLMPDQLKWIKPGKEIWLSNSFFDVLSIDSTGIPWKVKGLYDPEDTKLHMKIIRLLHAQTEQEDHELSLLTGAWAIWCALPLQPAQLVILHPFELHQSAHGSTILCAGYQQTSCLPPWHQLLIS